ncbi:MAG TPA: hypothetical protein VIJ69_09040 [Actinomycetota bacterium]
MVSLGAAPPGGEGPCHERDHQHGTGSDPGHLDARLVWIGEDSRGIELEIVALDLPEAIVVIHVMPTRLRG